MYNSLTLYPGHCEHELPHDTTVGYSATVTLEHPTERVLVTRCDLIGAFRGNGRLREDHWCAPKTAVVQRRLFRAHISGPCRFMLQAPAGSFLREFALEDAGGLCFRGAPVVMHTPDITLDYHIQPIRGWWGRKVFTTRTRGHGRLLLLVPCDLQLFDLAPDEVVYVNPRQLFAYTPDMPECIATYGNRLAARMGIHLCLRGPGRVLAGGRGAAPERRANAEHPERQGNIVHRMLKRYVPPYDLLID